MHEALCRSSGTTLDSVHTEDGPPITQRTSGLKRGCFAEPQSSRAALRDWSGSADPVLGWIEDRLAFVSGEEALKATSEALYADYRAWAEDQGYGSRFILTKPKFTERLKAAVATKGAYYKHSGNFRGFVGLKLLPHTAELIPANDRDAA